MHGGIFESSYVVPYIIGDFSNGCKMSDGRYLEFLEHLLSSSFIANILENKMVFNLS